MWQVLVLCSVLPLYQTGLIFKVTLSFFISNMGFQYTQNSHICRTCEIMFPDSYATHNQTPQWPSRHSLSVTHHQANRRGVILAPRLQQNRLSKPSQTTWGRIIPSFSPITPTQPSREAPWYSQQSSQQRERSCSSLAPILHPFAFSPPNPASSIHHF